MITIPTLDNWVPFNDVLVGEALNHPAFEQRQRVLTNHVLKFDEKLGVAYCVADEVWQLGKPGHLGRYVDPVSRKFF